MMTFKGKVVRGEGWGNLIGFPTANIDSRHLKDVKLRHGVYASWVYIDENRYMGITIVGVKHFFRKNKSKTEVYILEFERDIVGIELTVDVVEKIRPIKKFSHTQDLILEIQQDIKKAKKILGARM